MRTEAELVVRQESLGGRADYAAAEEEEEACEAEDAGGGGGWQDVQYTAAGAAAGPLCPGPSVSAP